MVETDYGIETGALAFNRIIKQSPAPTVIICSNDVLAAGALKEAKSLGISIPKDISVTGFDNIELAEALTPELTTVHVPHKKMVKYAAKALVNMVNGINFQKNVELNIYLKLRTSLDKPMRI